MTLDPNKDTEAALSHFHKAALAANVPFSARPEQAFLRLLGRFFRSSEHLITTMPWYITTTPTRLDHWRKAFHVRAIETLPGKLAAWGKAWDTAALPGTTPEQVQSLTTNKNKRGIKLVKKGDISKRSFDAAKASYDVDQADLDKARSALIQARSATLQAEAGLASAKADLGKPGEHNAQLRGAKGSSCVSVPPLQSWS